MMKKITFTLMFMTLILTSQANEEGKKIFTSRCTACHKIGGRLIGPDLKNVTQIREHGWLVSFIQSSQSMIKAGDPLARQLFIDYNQNVMPDNRDLNEEQIVNLLAYIEVQSNALESKENDQQKVKVDKTDLMGLKLEQAKAEAAIMASPYFKIIYWGFAIIMVAFVMWLGKVIAALATRD